MFLQASSVEMASIAPAPPKRCPVIDLPELMDILYECCPNTFFMANTSGRSPAGVDVPWVLMWSMSLGDSWASSKALLMLSVAPSPSG